MQQRQITYIYVLGPYSNNGNSKISQQLIKEFIMKKQQTDPITFQVKSLSKIYKNVSKQNIRILHQFCQYQYKRTNKIVCMANDMKNPISLIESIIKRPQLSEQLFAQLQLNYQKKYGPDVQPQIIQKTQVETQVKILQKLSYDFFQFIPNDCIMRIMEFLNPYSFFAFSITSRNHFSIRKSEAQSEYYKRLCTKIFKFVAIVLPNPCRFQKIKQYVLQRPNQYGPNTRNAVQNNLRRFVWKMDMESFNLEPNYYKSYGSYENLYIKCPRLNLNGYYVCRQKIVRIGQRNQKYPIAPIHIIYYYRYFRFFQDGTALYHVRSKRIKKQQVLNVLSKNLIQQNPNLQTLVGQFIHYKDKVFIKAARNQVVFSYELQIRSTDTKISNELKIMKYTLEIIDDHQQILQNLYVWKQLHQQKCFEYIHNDQLAEQNSAIIQANSL